MNRDLLYSHKITNFIHTILLLASMTGLICLLGWMLAGMNGVLFAVFAGLFVFLRSPHFSPHLVLRALKAQRLSLNNFSQLHEITRNLAVKAGLKYLPNLYYIPSLEMNAFAIGSEGNAAIGLTDGLLRNLNTRELSGIIGHEIAHIRNKDLRVMGLADIAGKITHSLSTIGQVLILLSLPLALAGGLHFSIVPLLILVIAPTISFLLQLALSRTREFEADLVSTQLTGDSYGLGSALKKLEQYQKGFWRQLFIPSWYYSQPSLFRTHPPTKERIERLLSLAQPDTRRGGLDMQPIYLKNCEG